MTLVAELLGAKTVIPIHYGGFAIDGHNVPSSDDEERFEQAASKRPYDMVKLEAGEPITV